MIRIMQDKIVHASPKKNSIAIFVKSTSRVDRRAELCAAQRQAGAWRVDCVRALVIANHVSRIAPTFCNA